MNNLKTDPELLKLLKEAKSKFDAMTPEEQRDMYRQQRESFVRSIVDWPKPNYHWEGNTKVYHSYEDYCND